MLQLAKAFDGGALPDALRERYRMADGPALKVALFLLCGGACDPDAVGDALSMSPDVVERSLAFWQKAGLLCETASAAAQAASAAPQQPVSSPQALAAPAVKAPVQRERSPLSPERVAELSLRDPAIATLLQETQVFLGRTLDPLESRTLLEIYDYDELPVEVILMLVAYCVPRLKNKRALTTMAARIADDWYAQGIVTVPDAEAHIRLLEQREVREAQVAQVLELKDPGFNKSQKARIAQWFEEYGFGLDFVREAYLAYGNNSIAYLHKILQGWYNSGVHSLNDVRKEFSNAQPKQKSGARSGNSYFKNAILNRGED